jgi:(E)-4-hydroxy-3-methylbut-2-enyl-diphosphate synthase
MVQTVRLLVREMEKEGMAFPLHLGVTEAGEGEDGRIKSAVGIGTLLLEGIGDTIRVSLSEDPEAEIPVAKTLIKYVRAKGAKGEGQKAKGADWKDLQKIEIPSLRPSPFALCPFVVSDRSHTEDADFNSDIVPDFVYIGKQSPEKFPDNIPLIVDFSAFSPAENTYPLFTTKEKEDWKKDMSPVGFICLSYSEWTDEILNILKEKPQTAIILSSETGNDIYRQKALIAELVRYNLPNPVILQQTYHASDLESFQIQSAIDCGSFFLDRLADGMMLSNDAGELPEKSAVTALEIDACSFGILQATGRRMTKTEYISCPSCGRTLFDLQTVIKKVKSATSHLKGLKIAIMGCIVNGPGEMADADYGYVGAGKGKVSLYKGKKCVLKNIPEEEAVEKLLELIKY